jgi:hypothetical protein
MFNPTVTTIETFVAQLRDNYYRIYGLLEPEYPNILAFVGRLALENIANSDAAYHDLHHTILVTQAGQEILRGRHIRAGGVKPADWLHLVVACLCHDIGYVRGVCQGDGSGTYVINADGEMFSPPPGATDAALTPYHVDRSKLFVRQRFGHVPVLDADRIAAAIELTRFPVPDDEEHSATNDLPGMVRAADLIGQMGDLNYLRKVAALWREFEETGANAKLGYESPADLRKGYAKFFWGVVRPYIEDSLLELQVTQEGKQWIANLYANVFAAEHQAPGLCRIE